MSRIETDFGKARKSETISIKPQYFIFSEGNVTERKYFKKLNSSILSNNVEIINVLRDYTCAGDSNPSKIIRLISELLKTNEDEISIKELKNRLENWGHESNRDVKTIIDTISRKYKDEKIIKYNEIKKIIFDYFSGEIYIDLSQNFMKYLLWQDITYYPISDKINLIVHRDNISFTETLYKEVKKFCENNHVGYYVSNPCFEFWLYLHFREIEKEKNDVLLKNKYVNKDKRYIENRLHQICGYTKNNLDFQKFESKINDAIKREKNYEENIIGLEKRLGSNVGKLVNEIINK